MSEPCGMWVTDPPPYSPPGLPPRSARAADQPVRICGMPAVRFFVGSEKSGGREARCEAHPRNAIPDFVLEVDEDEYLVHEVLTS